MSGIENIKDTEFVKELNLPGSNAFSVALKTAIKAAANFLARPDGTLTAVNEHDFGNAFLFLLIVKAKVSAN